MGFELPEQLNLAQRLLVERVAEGNGERVALRSARGDLTYREVLALAGSFAAALDELGVRREERVVIALRDSPEYVGALFAILGLGAVAVMVNPDLKPEGLADIFDRGRPTAAVVDEAVLAGFDRALAIASSRPRLLVVGEGTEAAPHVRFQPSSEADPAWSPVATHRDDPAIWLFSGGTTGPPKMVVQTHGSFANTTELYAVRTLGYGPDDITMAIPKLFFGYATGSNLFFPFAVGASAVLFPEHPTTEVVFAHLARFRPTILVNVPTMVNHMVGHPDAAAQDLSSLRFATSAGEALPESLYRQWKETFGVELLDGLGTAEMWHIFVTNRPGEVRPRTLGRPVEGFEVKVCDEEGGEVPAGEVGRLWVRGGSRAWGYWQDLPRSSDTFRGEWVVGGDLVRFDQDGYLEHHGRADDSLKVGGKWLAPQEVESCLIAHPAVAECVVIGVPDAAGLVKPVAFVIAPDPPDGLEEELQQWVIDRLEPYKHPRRVILVDRFPTTHLGKVDRTRLKALVEL